MKNSEAYPITICLKAAPEEVSIFAKKSCKHWYFHWFASWKSNKSVWSKSETGGLWKRNTSDNTEENED